MRLALVLFAVAGCHVQMSTPPICDVGADGVMLVNPSTQTCELFTSDSCNPECGPCEAGAVERPSWGKCASPCRDLDEDSCGRAPACRVARDYFSYYLNDKASFAGCWPLDTIQESTVSCYELDADTCSRHNDCTALYQRVESANPPTSQFMGCAREGELIGTCGGVVVCNGIKPPACPSGMQPGVAGGCFTGSCIPAEFCDVGPVPTDNL